MTMMTVKKKTESEEVVMLSKQRLFMHGCIALVISIVVALWVL